MTTHPDPVVRLALRRGLIEEARLAGGGDRGPAGAEHGPIERLAAAGADPRSLARLLAEAFGLEFVEPVGAAIPRETVACLPPVFLQRGRALPLELAGDGALRLAVADPADVETTDEAARLAGRSVQVCVATADAIRRALAFHLLGAADVPEGEERPAETSLAADGTGAPAAAARGDEADGAIIRIVQGIVREAVRRRASDIHLEPLAGRFRVRYRIDGALVEVEAPPKALEPPVISRVKLMADISIAERRVPQDGRIRTVVDGREIDLRVATLPTAHGESVVLRLLDRRELRPELSELGLQNDDRAELERHLAAPDGLVLATGPTGSGKTTTLYAALSRLNRVDRKIITVEDPVEYQLTGINQVPVNPVTGLTFSAALRAMLRQSPNVVLVGEVRDRETAEIAINAALTGHLVFSTLHTNDAAGAIGRLGDIGVKPFLVAAGLRAVAAQRLVRRVCEDCAAPWVPAEREQALLAGLVVPDGAARLRKGAGCPACLGTGYRGRVGLFELLVVDDEIRRLIYERAGRVALRRHARRTGRRSLREDGLSKVLAGLTTIEEVMAVTVGDTAGPA